MNNLSGAKNLTQEREMEALVVVYQTKISVKAKLLTKTQQFILAF